MSSAKTNPILKIRLFRTALRSPCSYRVGAVALDKKGDILGQACNTFRDGVVFMGNQHRKGTGVHAEAKLIKRYGKNIKSIIIMRIGNSGEILPIDPCESCSKLAEKLGIEILTVLGRDEKNELDHLH